MKEWPSNWHDLYLWLSLQNTNLAPKHWKSWFIAWEEVTFASDDGDGKSVTLEDLERLAWL